MKTIRFTAWLLLIPALAFTQDFEVPVPGNYAFKAAEDYDRYEKDMLRCVDWLMATPPNEQAAKRKDANAFVLMWLTGSPKVHLELKAEIMTFIDNGDLLILFLGSWGKYCLETGDFNNKVNGTTAGIEAVMDYYTRNKRVIPKNKGVDKYLKMKEKGTLKEFIEKNA